VSQGLPLDTVLSALTSLVLILYVVPLALRLPEPWPARFKVAAIACFGLALAVALYAALDHFL